MSYKNTQNIFCGANMILFERIYGAIPIVKYSASVPRDLGYSIFITKQNMQYLK